MRPPFKSPLFISSSCYCGFRVSVANGDIGKLALASQISINDFRIEMAAASIADDVGCLVKGHRWFIHTTADQRVKNIRQRHQSG